MWHNWLFRLEFIVLIVQAQFDPVDLSRLRDMLTQLSQTAADKTSAGGNASGSDGGAAAKQGVTLLVPMLEVLLSKQQGAEHHRSAGITTAVLEAERRIGELQVCLCQSVHNFRVMYLVPVSSQDWL